MNLSWRLERIKKIKNTKKLLRGKGGGGERNRKREGKKEKRKGENLIIEEKTDSQMETPDNHLGIEV